MRQLYFVDLPSGNEEQELRNLIGPWGEQHSADAFAEVFNAGAVHFWLKYRARVMPLDELHEIAQRQKGKQ